MAWRLQQKKQLKSGRGCTQEDRGGVESDRKEKTQRKVGRCRAERGKFPDKPGSWPWQTGQMPAYRVTTRILEPEKIATLSLPGLRKKVACLEPRTWGLKELGIYASSSSHTQSRTLPGREGRETGVWRHAKRWGNAWQTVETVAKGRRTVRSD